ncbi:MAG: energy transducer TonB [Bacteroidota bacterium]
MRLAFLLVLTLFAICANAQTQDTTIYDVAEESPRFPTNCEGLDTTAQAKSDCAQRGLMSYIAGRALYPQEAREANLEGTPVVSFVVEKTGVITNPTIVRDPGGGLGSAALQAVQLMQSEVRWRPAYNEGKPVRYRFNLPVRFRLEDPKPYILSGADTIYTEMTTPVIYQGGPEALVDYLDNSIEYPEDGLDSCLTGQIVVQLLVHPQYGVKVLDLTDYNNLGFEFWYQSIHSAHGTADKWTPAMLDDKPVPTAVDLTYTFSPENTACVAIASSYKTTMAQALEISKAYDAEDLAQTIASLDPLIDRFPKDVQLRLLRGQAHLDANNLEAACTDLNMARAVSGISWFNAVTSLICR